MSTLLIDTNIILRFLLKDIPSQFKEAQKLFIEAKKDKIELIIPQIVIFEISFVLERQLRFSKVSSIEKLESILSADYLKVQDKDIFNLALTFYKKFNISLPDCFLIAESQITEVPLFTFDKDLTKLSKGGEEF